MADRDVRVAGWRPTLASLAPAIDWLLARGVDVARVADGFETSVASLRVTLSRAHGRRPGLDAVARPVAVDEGAHSDDRRVDAYHDELQTITTAARRTSDFTHGLRALARLRRRLGRPSSDAMWELAALCDAERARCAVHLGATRSAVAFATGSRAIWSALGRDPGLCPSTLTLSHAWLYVNRPAPALRLLEEHEDAVARVGTRVGSDFLKQQGTAQMLTLLAARNGTLPVTPLRPFMRLGGVLDQEGGASGVEYRFATRWQLVWGLHPDVDACEALAEDVRAWRGPSSLESVVAENYAAEAALTLNEGSERFSDAQKRLDALGDRVAAYPHQAAVTFLLARTPRLRLDAPLRRVWVRQVRYFNPVRRH
jgi:hypothetical protein